MRSIRFVVRRAATAGLLGTLVICSACGAGSKTAEKTAAKVGCDVTQPASATTVNVLAYNSSAIDPYTNTLIASCSGDQINLKHDPIDFAGQVQKTAATLGGDTGTYDLIENYSAGIPQYANAGKLEPLDDLFAKYKDKYDLGALDPTMLKGMTYDGKLYGLPTQANISMFVYRKDIFDELKLTPPKTFADLKKAVAAIQESGKVKYPLAMPLLSSGDISTRYNMGVYSQGKSLVESDKPTYDSEAGKTVLEELKSLTPYMDPQVTTFDQPKVQQQLFNGQAAIAEMYSGRMVDMISAKNSKFSEQFGFMPSPSLLSGGDPYSTVSVDGWSIPKNTKVDKDLLFQLMAVSVSADASKSSVPAAYPSRKGIATEQNMPWVNAIETSIENGAHGPEMQPWFGEMQIATRPFVAKAIQGSEPIDQAAEDAQAAAATVLAKY